MKIAPWTAGKDAPPGVTVLDGTWRMELRTRPSGDSKPCASRPCSERSARSCDLPKPSRIRLHHLFAPSSLDGLRQRWENIILSSVRGLQQGPSLLKFGFVFIFSGFSPLLI